MPRVKGPLLHSGICGGRGTHMVYLAGKADHHVDSDRMIDHIVDLVEAKARDIAARTALAGEAAE